MEKAIVKSVAGPVDLNTAAITGGRVAMKNMKRVAFVINLGAGTTTAAHLFTLKQHTAASGGSSADLEVANPYFHKIGAATSFSKVEPTVAAAAYDLHALLGDNASMVVLEVLAEQLADGYTHASLDLADAGGAQLVSVIALGDSEFKPAYSQVV